MTAGQEKALKEVAGRLGVHRDWLFNLIKFESGWNPKAQNPRSSAAGLIQIVSARAREQGYRDSLDMIKQNPSIEKQLRGPVYEYLKGFKPFPTAQSLYMAVFYPAARFWDPNKFFPATVGQGSKQVPWSFLNPGIYTPAHYVARVEGRTVKALSGGVGALLVLGLALWFLVK